MGIGSSGVVNCANTYLGTANYTVADGYVADRTVIVDGNGPAQLNLNFARDEVLDPRITFSRTSNATRVNAQGLIEYAPHNLLTHSENFDNAAWTKTSVTVGANIITAPDGTTTADKITYTATSANITQTASSTTATYTISTYVKSSNTSFCRIRVAAITGGSGTAFSSFFNISAGTIAAAGVATADFGSITSNISAAANDWYRISVTFTVLSATTSIQYGIIAAQVSGGGSSNGDEIYIWGAQLNIGSLQPYYTTSVKNLLGYSQNFENAAWTKSNSSVLTNLLTYSQEFDNVIWTKNNTTVTANTSVAPDGTLTADTLIPDSVLVEHNAVSGNPVTIGTTYTVSVYAKAAGYNYLFIRGMGLGGSGGARFNLATGVVEGVTNYSSASITALSNGWYRCIATGTATATTGIYLNVSNQATFAAFSGDGTSGIYLWGAQLVQGTNPEEYTVTTSAPAPIQVMGPLGFLGAEKLVEDTATNTHLIQQTPTYQAGTIYTHSVYAKAGERSYLQLRTTSTSTFSASFDLVNGTYSQLAANTTAVITSVGNGWYRCSITFTAGASAVGATRIALMQNATTQSYTGDGTSGIYIFGAQLSDSASLGPYSYNFGAAPTSSAYYGPRFDYDPVTLASKGLLIEEQRTNLIKASENLSAVTWNKTGTPVLDAAIQDPSGNINTVYYPTVSEIYQIFDGAGVGTISLSFFGKKREGSSNNIIVIQIFQQVSGSVVDLGTYGFSLVAANPDSTYFKNIKREQYQNGWYRFSCQIVANTGAGTGNFSANSRIDIEGGSAQNYVWGLQIELNAFPTSYIPTTSASVTRAADNASMVGTNFSSWYNQSEGTVYSQWILGGDNISTSVYSISDGSASNLMRSRYNSAGTGIDNAVITSGATVAVLNATNQITTYSSYKNAMAYLVNDFARAANTVLVTDNSGAIPIVNQINIGASVGAVEQLNGHIQSIKYFNKRLLNTYLQSLTQ